MYINSPIVKAFEQYSADLAAKHDKYERLVKLSRDVTISSKRVIFSIHALMRSSNVHQDMDKIKESFRTIEETMLKTIAKEVENEDKYQYARAYLWGLQEYIEALTFFYYITSGTLFNYDDIVKNLTYHVGDDASADGNSSGAQESPSNKSSDEVSDGKEEMAPKDLSVAQKEARRTIALRLDILDYVLGVQDLTGELMRHCISSFAANRRAEGYSSCDFVRRLYSAMMLLSNVPSKDFYKKFDISRQSLEKMEMACYNMNVRGSEVVAFQTDEPPSFYD